MSEENWGLATFDSGRGGGDLGLLNDAELSELSCTKLCYKSTFWRTHTVYVPQTTYHKHHIPHITRAVPSSGIYLIFIYTRLLDPCALGTPIRSIYLMSPWRVRTIQKWYLLTRSLHLCECQIWFGYWDWNRTELYGFYNLLAHPLSSYLTIIISSKA